MSGAVRPAVLLLGTLHTADWIVEHEAEVLDVVSRLARFGSTRIAIETCTLTWSRCRVRD